jgi:hypothetical protein
MPPIVLDISASFLRIALTLVAGYLVKSGALAEGDAQAYVLKLTAALSLVVAAMLWAAWTRVRDRLKFMTATYLAQVTEHQVEARMKNPKLENPSVLTPKTDIPSV